MIKTILAAAGIPAKQSRYLNPPGSTYAVYMDDTDTLSGPDPTPGAPLLIRHSATIELYAPTLDPVSEAAIETACAARGVHWEKQGAYWLNSAQRYQTVYDIEYTEKRRA